jgi:hypothetical protein
MKIPPIESLPGHAGPTDWARLIHCDPVTIWRADTVYKKLKRVNPGSPKPLYSRESVLEWLGVPQVSNKPVPTKNFQKPAKRRRAAAVR